jgi:hypothetical protein
MDLENSSMLINLTRNELKALLRLVEEEEVKPLNGPIQLDLIAEDLRVSLLRKLWTYVMDESSMMAESRTESEMVR